MNEPSDRKQTSRWLEFNYFEKLYLGIVCILALCALVTMIIAVTRHVIHWQKLLQDWYLM